MEIERHRPRHGVKDAHPDVLAHPGFARRGEMGCEFGEVPRDGSGDIVLGERAGTDEHLSHVRPRVGLSIDLVLFSKLLQNAQELAHAR